MIIASLACLNIYLFKVVSNETLLSISIASRVIPLIIIMPLGPLIYFYVKSSYGVPFIFKKEKAHFGSILLDLVPSLISIVSIVLFFAGVFSSIEPQKVGAFIEMYEKYADVPRWISTSVYLILAFRFFFSIHPVTKRQNWIKQFLLVFGVFQIVWLFHLIPYLVPTSSSWLLETLSWYPIYIPLTILVYWLGVNGMVQSKNGRTSLLIDHQDFKETVDSLNKIMHNEKLFLSPTLSLGQVVKKTAINQKKVSSALNQYLGKSFNEYVNEFRVDEVKRKMADQLYSHLSITGIAFESGFNSQATFQRSFKMIAKMTPRAYLTTLKNESNNTHS